jgi:hypothetical protein
MSDPENTIAEIVWAAGWNQRVSLIRRIPEAYGTAAHRNLYGELARRLYVPQLTPDFAYVFWREEFRLPAVAGPYLLAEDATRGFVDVSAESLTEVILKHPTTVIIWRLIVGYTRQEFSSAIEIVATELELPPVSPSRIASLESGSGRPGKRDEARVIAEVTSRAVGGQLWPDPEDGRRNKQERPDLDEGWDTVRRYATHGVPLPVLLHQRLYGGAFRQLLDSTSAKRGDRLENELVEQLTQRGIPHIRTGSHNQMEIRARFNITIQPTPDFVFFDSSESLRAILEAKLTNDGGTARDKASRFAIMRNESRRLGGIPVFALIDGLGWTRASDALGPVIRDCDGRVFTSATLSEMFDVDPFPALERLRHVAAE